MRAATLPVVLAALALAACSGDAATDAGPTTTTVPAVASAGCGAPARVSAGEKRLTFASSGRERSYIRRVPPVHDGTRPVPLVVDFHGYAEGAEIHTLFSKLGPYGDEQGFVTVTPQGEGEPSRWIPTRASDDVTFVRELLDGVERTLCVDRARIFVTGLSNGAFMTSAVACALADRVAAVAPVAGIRDIGGCRPARRVPVVAFHGTADEFVKYDGGYGAGAAQLPTPDGGRFGDTNAFRDAPDAPPVPEITAAWAARNGCDDEPIETKPTVDTTLTRYACPGGADVELYTVIDGGHTWPGSELGVAVEGVIGRTTMLISANEIMWSFFRAHPLRTVR